MMMQKSDDESVEFIGDYKPDYSQIISLLRRLFGIAECELIGYGLSCYPCPYHPNEKYDRLIIDPRNKMRRIVCAKEPLINRFTEMNNSDELFNELNEKFDAIAKKLKKPPAKYTDTLFSEIIERHYVLTNLIITVHDKKTKALKSYKYHPEEGIYIEITTDEMESELLKLFQTFTSYKPSLSLLNEMAKNIRKLTERPGDEDIFLPIKGNVFYLVGRVRDIEVNTITGEVRILEKDPINRPFIERLPYDFAIDPPKDPPEEFKIFEKYTTPKFLNNVLILLAKAFIYNGLNYIFVIISRGHGTGKTSFFYILDTISGGKVIKVDPKHFKGQFFESRLVNKTIMVLEEYRGRYEVINDKLKEFASRTTSIEGDKKFETGVKAKNMLTVAITTNKAEFPWEFLVDLAFMSRVCFTPFVYYREGTPLPDWVDPGDDKEKQLKREKVVLYTIMNIVPKVLRNEIKPVSYNNAVLIQWVDKKTEEDTEKGIKVAKLKPPDGIDDFLEEMAYKDTSDANNYAVFMTLDDLFNLYLRWCDKKETYLPMSDAEFKNYLEYGAKSIYVVTRKVKKDDKIVEEKGVYIRKANLSDYI